MPVKLDFKLAPKDAYRYLTGKGYRLSYDYDELAGAAHQLSFTVAKVTRLDLLQDLHASLTDSMRAGTPFATWRANLRPILEEKGWWGTRDIMDPRTGEVRQVHIGARRLKHIFKTNMRVAYNVGRYKKQMRLSEAVYWRYTSLLLPTSREAHRRLHGTVLHRDHPFWRRNYPPNGHGCKCKVTAWTRQALDRRGLTVSQDTPADIAHPDWAYDVGAGARVSRISQLALGPNLALLKPNPALQDFDEAALKQRFYQRLGIPPGGLFIDPVGDPMWVGDELFTRASGQSKLKKRNRHVYLDAFSDVLADPDEMYLELDTRQNGQTRLVKKMFRYFKTEQGKTHALIALFKYQRDKTQGVSLYVIDNEKTVEKKRTGRLIYSKRRNHPAPSAHPSKGGE